MQHQQAGCQSYIHANPPTDPHHIIASYSEILNEKTVHDVVNMQVRMLSDQGVKEVTLLGQNVNSYSDFSTTNPNQSHNKAQKMAGQPDQPLFDTHYARGFRSVYRPNRHGALSFADLLGQVAEIDPEMRIRFTSPHPKDFSDDVLDVIAQYDNICKQLHMPAQSGSTSVLDRMKRGYSREAYDILVDNVRNKVPGVALSTDMIAGFCGETEEEHASSIDLLKKTGYDLAFLFAYSERERTHAARHLADDVPNEVKLRRLQELIQVYREELHKRAIGEEGRYHLVLVEGPSRRSDTMLTGRTDTFKRVVFDDIEMEASLDVNDARCGGRVRAGAGDYVAVKIVVGGGGTLKGIPVARTSIREFVSVHGSTVPPRCF